MLPASLPLNAREPRGARVGMGYLSFGLGVGPPLLANYCRVLTSVYVDWLGVGNQLLGYPLRFPKEYRKVAKYRFSYVLLDDKYNDLPIEIVLMG